MNLGVKKNRQGMRCFSLVREHCGIQETFQCVVSGHYSGVYCFVEFHVESINSDKVIGNCSSRSFQNGFSDRLSSDSTSLHAFREFGYE
jgi:hypothetical protein